jgi:CTP:molybdopterin cytidylyltransferase MocA
LPYADRRYTTDNPAEELESLRRLLQAVEEERLMLLMRRDDPKVPTGSVMEIASLQGAMESNSGPISTDGASPKKTSPVGMEKLLTVTHFQTEIENADG